ncbi:MAG TPA: di-heme oxidoredictase family protein [Bacteroidia bacterium]
MRNRFKLIISFALLVSVFAVSCRKYDENANDPQAEWFSGGNQTFFDGTVTGFDHAFNGMTEAQISAHEVGDKAFDATFVTAPAPLNSGLGPLYNNVSCVSCHVNDGRGKPPLAGEAMKSMLLRVSIPGSNPHGGPNPIPGFGGQLQPRSIVGKLPEAEVQMSYTYINGNFPDGTPYQLRKPNFTLKSLEVSIPGDIMISPRVAPPVFGLGLLEAIPESAIMSREDINDADGDGISGKANRVWEVITESYKLGRFGWKAGQPSLIQQSAGAYNEDMGVTNFIFPIENSFGQTQYDGLNDDVELSDSLLKAVAFYMQTLGVPARRLVNDPMVTEGKRVFNLVGCGSCHVSTYTTALNMAFPPVSNQKIFPYTDLLLHDMGAELADFRPEFLADGYEWRTPALWGIGLTKKINGHEYFLHDGRARNLVEAILWHGGEAEASRQKFTQLNTSERQALLKFLESL